MSCIGMGERIKPCIDVENLNAWCEDNYLAPELTVDIHLDHDDIHHDDNVDNEEQQDNKVVCLNSRCAQTIGMRKQKLRQLIQQAGEVNGGVLYQKDFFSLIRKIHECDNCKCPKTVLDLAKV